MVDMPAHLHRILAACVLTAALAVVPGRSMGAEPGQSASTPAVDHSAGHMQPAVSAPAWLAEINKYRLAGGLHPVTDEPAWSAGIAHHNTYLALTAAKYYTGQYQSLHTENPASPYYTADGALEAGRSDLFAGAYFSSPVQYIDGWLRAPFHAIGMLRPGLTKVAFAASSGSAGLDVIGGLQDSTPTTPILFPGAGMTPNLTSCGGELPSPLESCPFPVGASPGLPLVVLLPAAPAADLAAQVTGSDGTRESTQDGTLCVVDEHTYRTSDPIYGPTGLSILQGDHAVLLISAEPYGWGRQHVLVTQSGRTNIDWSFITAPPGPLTAGRSYTLHVAAGASAVLGNLTVTNTNAAGFATVYPCRAGRPNASNVNYTPAQTSSNFAVTAADANGDICIFTSGQTDVVWDQVGTTTAFSPPAHIADDRCPLPDPHP
jgi:hypothetical protein